MSESVEGRADGMDARSLPGVGFDSPFASHVLVVFALFARHSPPHAEIFGADGLVVVVVVARRW